MMPTVTAAEIKALRAQLGLTQRAFAARYHVPLKTLHGWEQGRRALDPAASALLRLIAFHPEHAANALAWLAHRLQAASLDKQ